MHPSRERARAQILTRPHATMLSSSRGSVVLKGDEIFLVTTGNGDVPLRGESGCGLFFHDCRMLDGYELSLANRQPTLLSGASLRGFETVHHLTNPDLDAADGSVVPRHSLAIVRRRRIDAGVVHEELSIENHGMAGASFTLQLVFRARFQDVFVVRGLTSRTRGTLRKPRVDQPGRVELAYRGRDGRERLTCLSFSPPPDETEAERVTHRLRLARGEKITLHIAIHVLTIEPDDARSAHEAPRTCAPPESKLSKPPHREPPVRSSSPLFDRVLHCAQRDLELLRSELDGSSYFTAGIPWFATLFGRDAAITALQAMWCDRSVACETLHLLARYQARDTDDYRDAEPGKILHELRRGELARTGAVPQSPAYYGSVDATLLFVMLLRECTRWTGHLELAHELRPALDAALGWMEHRVRSGPGGYLCYTGSYPTGLVNQGWKDSGNAIVRSDGSLASPPIALCEVQGYAYRAWREAAGLLRELGDAAAASPLEQQAAELRERFDRDYWDEHLGCYVMGLEAGGRPLDVAASNAGQVLWSGIAPHERAARVARRLMEPDLFSGWGVRTLSSKAAAYNPLGYHRGSVWPHDNSLILAGLRRYGEDDAALRIFDGLFDAASMLRDHRLPELFCGYDRSEDEQRPVPYPVACSPQAWAAGSLPYALASLLGLAPDGLRHTLRIHRPRLPAWLSHVELTGLHVGEASVDLRFERRGPGTEVEVSGKVRQGELSIECNERDASIDGGP